MQWVIWYEGFVVKVGCTPRLTRMCPQIRQPQAEVLWKEHFDALFEAAKFGGPYAGKI